MATAAGPGQISVWGVTSALLHITESCPSLGRYLERKEGCVATAKRLPSPELHAMAAQQPVPLNEDLGFLFHPWLAENTAAGYCAAV